MATLQFGSASADMRLTDADYGIQSLQSFESFLEAFTANPPASTVILQNTASIRQIRLFDTVGQFVTVTFQGDVLFSRATSFSVEATGVRQTNFGDFSFTPTGVVFGTANQLENLNVSNGTLINGLSNFSLAVDSGAVNYPGDDVLFSGNDNILGGSGNDYLLGYDGNDRLVGGAGNDTLVGGTGVDVADYSSAASGVTVELWRSLASTDGQGGVDVLSSIENIVGSSFNDSLSGDNGNNVLMGGLGFDQLYGGTGIDTAYYGGASSGITVALWNSQASNDGQGGADYLNGIENIIGSAFNDVVSGDNNDNVFRGGAGFDQFYGGVGSDTADYSDAASGVTVELWNSQASNDGLGGADYLNSVENVVGSAFADVLSGDNNNNVFKGGAGSDQFYGGGGTDTADYSDATSAVTANLATFSASNDGQGAGDYLNSIENLVGSGFDDTFFGDGVANLLSGSGGNDWLGGGAGNDTLDGGSGSDTTDYSSAGFGVSVDLAAQYGVDGLGGTDTLISIENAIGSAFNDYLSGTAGDNLFRGGGGNDILVGLAGSDTADYSSAGFGVTVDLAGQYGVDGLGGTDFLVSIENIIGSSFNDYLSGSVADNIFRGGAGNDTFAGGAGIDTADYGNAAASVTVNLAGSFAVDGQGGTDFMVGIENIIGSAFADVLVGDANANIMTGGAGNDVFRGGSGFDQLLGGAGVDTADYSGATSGVTSNLAAFFTSNDGQGWGDYIVDVENLIGSAFADTLAGDGNANRIDGGGGNDFMAGNGGADNFAFTSGSGLDTVTDFSVAQGDKINLQSNLNNSGITTGTSALAHTFDAGGNAIIDLGSGSSITLLGITKASLTATDFLIF